MLALSKAAAPDVASAFEIAAGASAVEEGDDRVRPGAALHVGFNESYASRVYFYGREYGPVREETYLVTASKRWGLFKTETVTASLGVALMNERIELDFKDEASSTYDKKEDNYNVGAAFGIAWSLPRKTSPFFLTVSWDSHLFPAGLNGLIFLSTGRKQTISLATGVAIR